MWKQGKDTLVSTYEFADFFKAVVFIEKISLLCDRLQHLPQWQNSLHRVRVEIAPNKAGRIESTADLQQQIDEIYQGI
jgi:4a-hydroxytetrahydrobiopterin dehydratase